MGDKWELLGYVTIDTAKLLLVDPMHLGDLDSTPDDKTQFSIPGGEFSAVQVGTGMGDGRYRVEGLYRDSPFGRRLGEVRVRFLDDDGNYLGGDQ